VRRALVITVSDRSAAGQRPDASGPAAAERLSGAGFDVAEPDIVADDHDELVAALRAGITADYDLIVTTGGTGLGPRDITPEATAAVIEREVPGLTELMRAEGRAKTPLAVLSRARAGAAGRTLIVNLPGSPAGVRESLDAILEVLGHALDVLAGGDDH
jgi:molybdenum cofactor biosynthesis protein B